jgi:hypothetical protein
MVTDLRPVREPTKGGEVRVTMTGPSLLYAKGWRRLDECLTTVST